MNIVGIQKRLKNTDMPGIMTHWGDFFQGEHMQKLIGENSPIIAVYFNYESDHSGAYDLLIGGEREVLNGYKSIEIKEGNYKEYKTQGAGSGPVGKLWGEIWSDTSIKRAYTTDYEVYSGDPKNPQISIFIGII